MPFSCYRQVRDKYHNADIFKGLTFKVQYHQFTSIDHVLKCPDSSKNQERIFVRGDTVNVFLPPGIADITALDNCDDCVWFVVAKAKRNFANKLWRRSFKSIRGALDLSSIKLIEEFIPIVEYGRVNREPKVKSRPSDAIDLVSQQQQSQSQQSLSSSLGSSGSNMGAVCANDDGGISGSVGEIGGSDSEFDEKLVRLLKSSAVLPRLVALRKTQVPPQPLSPVLPDDKLFIGECVDDSSSSKKKGFGSEGVAENKEFVPIRPPISTSPSLQTLINVSSAMPKEIVKKENTTNNTTNNTNSNTNNNCNTNNACNNNGNGNDVEKIVSDSDSGKVTTIYSPLLKPDPELLAPLPSQSSTTQINPPLPSTSPSLSQNISQNIPQNVPQNIHNFNEGSHYSTMPAQLPPTLSSLSSSSSSSSSTSTNPNNISTIIRCSNSSSSSSSSSMSTGIMTSSGVIGVVGVGVVGAAGAAAGTAGMAYEVECFQINPVQGKSLWIECGLYPIYKDGALVYPVVEEPVFPSVVRHSDDSTLFDSLVSVGQECLNSPSFKNPPK